MSRNLVGVWLSNPEAFAADNDQNLVNRIRRKPPHRDRRRAHPPDLPTTPGNIEPTHENSIDKHRRHL